jgi:hypothetical protein
VCCNGCDLPRLVRLNAADRHQRVAGLRQCLGDQVFELAGLVATERKAAVAVLAFGKQVDLAAEMRAQALQGLDRRRAKGQCVTRKAAEVHGRSCGC